VLFCYSNELLQCQLGIRSTPSMFFDNVLRPIAHVFFIFVLLFGVYVYLGQECVWWSYVSQALQRS